VSPRRIALLACALAAFAAACGGSPRPAATVDGTDITQQDVVDELDAIRANPGYLQAIEGQGATVLGEEQGAFDSAFVASQLALRIQYAIVSNEVERRDIAPDDTCRTAARDSLVQQLAGLDPSGDGETVLGAFPEPYQDYLVDREADVLVLQGDLIEQPCLADTAVESYYEEHEDEFEQACSAHILLATRDEADDIVALLRAGADFAALAAERSTDTGSAVGGGTLPCVLPGQLIPELDAALFGQPVGEIGDPVETGFGFHVVRVDSRRVAPLAEVREAVRQGLATEVQAAFGDWFRDAIAAADVDVDPRYGDWDPTNAEILRPGSGAATTSTTAGAIP
jgi:hypothetical protein